MKILVYGYGNPGRQDDALGNELVNKLDIWLKEKNIKNVDIDSNYQLNIEDADTISNYDFVIFVDASEELIEDVLFTEVDSSEAKIEFSMHAVSSSFVLDLCKKMYNKFPETYLIHIKGYKWDFEMPMSEKAKQNLEKAFNIVTKILEKPETAKDYLGESLKSFRNN